VLGVGLHVVIPHEDQDVGDSDDRGGDEEQNARPL
jgi:hypothetical protein